MGAPRARGARGAHEWAVGEACCPENCCDPSGALASPTLSLCTRSAPARLGAAHARVRNAHAADLDECKDRAYCRWWSDASCWTRGDDGGSSSAAPGPHDHAIVRNQGSTPCVIHVPAEGVLVDAITFAGSASVVLRARGVATMTVGLIRVSMDEGHGVFVNADWLQLAVRRQVRVEQGELLWQGSHVFCLGHALSCPAVPQ